MPFTIGGEWVPSKPAFQTPHKPVKVRLVKRGQKLITEILNLNMTSKEIAGLASSIKKSLGCGGAVKDDRIEIQGDKVESVRKALERVGIKST